MKAIALMWCVVSLLGSVGVMLWMTAHAPVLLPIAFMGCIVVMFAGASIIGHFGGKL